MNDTPETTKYSIQFIELKAEPWQGLLNGEQMLKLWLELRDNLHLEVDSTSQEARLYRALNERFIADVSMVYWQESNPTQ